MNPLHAHLSDLLAPVVAALGVQRPGDMGVSEPPSRIAGFHACSNAPLRLARELKRPPIEIAHDLAAALTGADGIETAEACIPGFVNVRFTADTLARLGTLAPVFENANGLTVLDFGGPNIKPMHVGHLRSLVLGETIRRILVATGHTVMSDVHWGDWGLPSGMILALLRREHPDHPCFTEFGSQALLPVRAADVARIYPAAAALAKADDTFAVEAREATRALQAGEPRLLALWDALCAEAKANIGLTFERLGAHFDLSLGERDAQADVPVVMAMARASGICREEDGVLLVPVALPSDPKEPPPLVLQRADGSSLYAATDLATLVARMRDLAPSRVVYVVDGRQNLHFTQTFRAARLLGIVPSVVELTHRPFGTVNAPDGKPFRTRDGETMPLGELLDTAVAAALQRLDEGGRVPEAERALTAECVGLAAVRIADMSQTAVNGYVLDVDRIVRFEGNTGSALLYSVVRLRSVLGRAAASGIVASDSVVAALMVPGEAGETAAALVLRMAAYGQALQSAADEMEPFRLTGWAFSTSSAVGRFWNACPLLTEPDMEVCSARVALAALVEAQMSGALEILGCRIPEAM